MCFVLCGGLLEFKKQKKKADQRNCKLKTTKWTAKAFNIFILFNLVKQIYRPNPTFGAALSNWSATHAYFRNSIGSWFPLFSPFLSYLLGSYACKRQTYLSTENSPFYTLSFKYLIYSSFSIGFTLGDLTHNALTFQFQ